MKKNTQIKTKLIPKLRFKEFEDDWIKKKLGEISTKITDGTHDTPKKSKKGNVYLTAIHIKDGFIDYKNCYYLSDEEHNKIYRRCNPEKGDLLMVNIGAGTATTALVEVEFEFSLKNVALIKPKHEIINSNFFSQVQRNNSFRLRHRLSSGGAQPFLSLKQIGKLKLNIPSLQEQQKIATFLTAVDTKIQQLTKKKTLLEDYKKGVMQQLFSQQLRFKNDDGSSFPGWEEKRLGEVFKAERGKGISKGEVTEDGVNDCILYGELYTKYNEVIFEVISKTNSSYGLKSKIGDLLIPSSTTTTGIDLANVTALNFENIRLGGDIIVLRGKEKINNVFYAYYLSNYKKYQIASRAQGITIVHLYYSGIKDINIDLPCFKEQQKIARYLSAIDDKIANVQTQLEKTQTFKKGLLQGLFV